MTRSPIVAGMFYDASPKACRQAVENLLAKVVVPGDLPRKLYGGVVPHAGWICSGSVAAMTFQCLQERWSGQTILLLGAVHSVSDPMGLLYARGAWASPLGSIAVDEELGEQILRSCPDVREKPEAHANEHSLEVQVPFIQVCWPDAKILPLMVPPTALASGIGQQVGEVLLDRDDSVLVIASSDLTHYGPRYGVTPAGVGQKGLDWACRNDQGVLGLIEQLAAEKVVDEASEHLNACGSGAIAAAIAACRTIGAKKGLVLQHTNSYETLKDLYPVEAADVVGYASAVFA